jgi:hypothetical protein
VYCRVIHPLPAASTIRGLLTVWLVTFGANCGVQLSPLPNLIGSDARIDGGAPNFDATVPTCTAGDVNRISPDTGHCYMFFGTPMVRANAAAACQDLGAQLVSITSLAEHELVASMIGTTLAMTSGSDLAVEGTFVWDSGEPFNYTNFRSGEPNNALNRFQEDCLVLAGPIVGKGWDDRACMPQPPLLPVADFTFVCERR